MQQLREKLTLLTEKHLKDAEEKAVEAAAPPASRVSHSAIQLNVVVVVVVIVVVTTSMTARASFVAGVGRFEFSSIKRYCIV